MIYEMNIYSFIKNIGCSFSNIPSFFGMLSLKNKLMNEHAY